MLGKKSKLLTFAATKTRLYLSGDKNGRDIRREICAKKLHTILSDALPERKLFCHKAEGMVKFNWTVVAEVVPGGKEDTPNIRWNKNLLEELGLDERARASTEGLFALSAGAGRGGPPPEYL